MIACKVSARRGILWLGRRYPTSICIAARMSMTAIHAVKIASTTKTITSFTSLRYFRATLTSFARLFVCALPTPYEKHNMNRPILSIAGYSLLASIYSHLSILISDKGLVVPVCPECYSRDLVRFGKYQGKQKWHCWNCGLTTIHVLRRMPSNKPKVRKSKKG